MAGIHRTTPSQAGRAARFYYARKPRPRLTGRQTAKQQGRQAGPADVFKLYNVRAGSRPRPTMQDQHHAGPQTPNHPQRFAGRMHAAPTHGPNAIATMRPLRTERHAIQTVTGRHRAVGSGHERPPYHARSTPRRPANACPRPCGPAGSGRQMGCRLFPPQPLRRRPYTKPRQAKFVNLYGAALQMAAKRLQ